MGVIRGPEARRTIGEEFCRQICGGFFFNKVWDESAFPPTRLAVIAEDVEVLKQYARLDRVPLRVSVGISHLSVKIASLGSLQPPVHLRSSCIFAIKFLTQTQH